MKNKVNAIIWHEICQNLINKLLEFDLYLLSTKNTEVRKEFEKVIEIIGDIDIYFDANEKNNSKII